MARPIKKLAIVDQDLLTPEEIAELQLEAEGQVLADRKAKAKKAMLAEFKKAEAGKNDPAQEVLDYHVTLPRFCNYVVIDGVQYFHNTSYDFSRQALDSVRDIVANAWKHEEAAFGDRDPNAYQRKFNQAVGPNSRVALSNHFTRV